MTNKLKMLSMAVLATVAAVTSTQAATATVTSATVLNTVGVQLTVYTQEAPTTNNAKTLISEKVKQSAFNTKALLAALQATMADKGFNTNTAKLVLAQSYTDTNVYVFLQTNTATTNVTTNYSTQTNYAGLTNANGNTIATNVVFTNSTSQYEVVDDKVVYPLTNNDFYFGFDEYAKSGTEKATNGVGINGTGSGTAYGFGYVSVNSPADWTFDVSGFGSGTGVSKNLGTHKAPIFIEIKDFSSAVAGTGSMGGTLVPYYITNVVGTNTIITTNTYLTNATSVLLKGTLTESFWKITTP
ncbi:MAG: hypothetical protein ABSH38_15100 [Verrucomicrobiota bacterium]|jgi:hypothetical protein